MVLRDKIITSPGAEGSWHLQCPPPFSQVAVVPLQGGRQTDEDERTGTLRGMRNREQGEGLEPRRRRRRALRSRALGLWSLRPALLLPRDSTLPPPTGRDGGRSSDWAGP